MPDLDTKFNNPWFGIVLIGGLIGFGLYEYAASTFAANILCILSDIRDKL